MNEFLFYSSFFLRCKMCFLFLWMIMAVGCVKRDAEYKEFPFMLAVVNGEVGLVECGAALVSERLFLTSGKCVVKYTLGSFQYKDPRVYYVLAGTRYLWAKEYGYRKRYIKDWKYHPFFDVVLGGIPTHDLAYGTLFFPFNLNSYVFPIPFIKEKSEILIKLERMMEDGEVCYTLGWGSTKPIWNVSAQKYEYTNSTDVLHVIPVKILRDDICLDGLCRMDGKLCSFDLKWYGNICGISDEMICAPYSGGPLVCQDRIWGVVGWSFCNETSPTFFSNGNLFLDIDFASASNLLTPSCLLILMIEIVKQLGHS